jgi:hypothetical protein
LNGRDHLEDLGVDGKIILKFFLKNLVSRSWVRCSWIRVGFIGNESSVSLRTRRANYNFIKKDVIKEEVQNQFRAILGPNSTSDY